VATRRLTHFVYIVRCRDGSLYTGYTRDPEARTLAHNAGKGAKYTAGRRPVTLVYVKGYRTKGRALAREYAIKQLTRRDKDELLGPRAPGLKPQASSPKPQASSPKPPRP
jgi:putative endonuclease